jgi:polyhydroxyalkanoate synthase
MIHWGQPGPEEELFGLNEYADRLILNCLEVIEAELGQSQLFLAGHSLGGTLTAIFASLYPDRLRGLVLIAAPLHFGSTVGIFGPLAAAIDHVRHTAKLPARVPGSFLSLLSLMASPSTFGRERWLDLVKSFPDPQALRNHLRVERWTLDEMPMPRRLFEEVVKLLIREDRLLRGTLMVGGRRAAPELIRAPLLCIADARCRIVPPEAILPFQEAIGSADKRLLWYEGDKGVSLQHVGPLVGQTAHQQLWPEILRWIRTHSQKP